MRAIINKITQSETRSWVEVAITIHYPHIYSDTKSSPENIEKYINDRLSLDNLHVGECEVTQTLVKPLSVSDVINDY